jgi:regulator of protease activity HflC (stomatin/prohibitin superfamily)
MKKMFSFVAFIMLSFVFLTSCSRISPTEVGFKIENAGDYRGIDSLPLLTGWQFYMPGFSYIVTMPTTQEHVAWTESTTEGNPVDESITVACSGGAGFKMDVGLNYRVNPNKASKIYLKYKTDNLNSITQTYIRNIVRGSMQDVSGTLTVDSILYNLPSYEHTVRDVLTKRLEVEGFVVDNFNILKQPIPTNADLANSINQKIKARQDAERTIVELQSSKAEADKEIAKARGDSSSRVIRAQAEAKEILVKQEALQHSPQYVELVKAQKWNGVLPQVMGGSGGMMLNLDKK